MILVQDVDMATKDISSKINLFAKSKSSCSMQVPTISNIAETSPKTLRTQDDEVS